MPEEEDMRKAYLVAARERGPGPARYKLPTCFGLLGHDLTKTIMPAHTFGKKFPHMFKVECSPGPAYGVNSKLTRHGMDGTPVYSMLARAKDGSVFETPSPSAYYREKVHPQGERHAPVYSMGSRTRYRRRDANPASSSYTLPSMLGFGMPTKTSAPAYTMTGRDKHGGASVDLAKTPGPGKYDKVPLNIFIRREPAYSMLGRTLFTGGVHKIPGPGSHSPEKVYANKPCAPKFSMGIKHSDYLTPLIIEVQD